MEELLSQSEEKLIHFMQEAQMSEEEIEVSLGMWYELGITEQVLQILSRKEPPYSKEQILMVERNLALPLIKR